MRCINPIIKAGQAAAGAAAGDGGRGTGDGRIVNDMNDPLTEENVKQLRAVLNKPKRFRLPDPRVKAFQKLYFAGKLDACLQDVLSVIEREIDNIANATDPSDQLLIDLADKVKLADYNATPEHVATFARLVNKAAGLQTAETASAFQVGAKYFILESLKSRLLEFLKDGKDHAEFLCALQK
jgi:hypothetical protein